MFVVLRNYYFYHMIRLIALLQANWVLKYAISIICVKNGGTT